MKSLRLHPRRTRSHSRDPERGIAILITVAMLLLIAAVAMAAINQAGTEASAGGRTRASARNLYAAESGLQMAQKRLFDNPPNTNAFSLVIDGTRTVESRRRTDGAPQPLTSSGYGPPPEGYEINAGSNFFSKNYLVNITSTAPGGTVTELEAKIGLLQAGTGGQ